MEIKRSEFGEWKRYVKLLDKRIEIYRKQNTRLLESNSKLVENQKHYLIRKTNRTKAYEKYKRELFSIVQLKKRIVDFLDCSTLPKRVNTKGRDFVVKLTKAGINHLWYLVDNIAILRSIIEERKLLQAVPSSEEASEEAFNEVLPSEDTISTAETPVTNNEPT